MRPRRQRAEVKLPKKAVRAQNPAKGKPANPPPAVAAAAGAPVDVRGDLTRYTVDVTCSLAFGTDVTTLSREEADPLQHHLDTIFTGIARRINAIWPTWRWLRTPADRRIDRSLAAAGKSVHGFIDNTRALMRRQPELRLPAPPAGRAGSRRAWGW